MFSSAKFLSPIVTAGLPAPAPLAVAVELLVDDALELLDDELLLPHAARPATSAAADSSAPTLRPIDRLQRVRGLSRLLM
jgi:hypothetical protein